MNKLVVILCLLSVLCHFSQTNQDVIVNYLGKFNRHSGSRYIDVFFSCSVRGTFLHWQYNTKQLRILEKGEVGRTFVEIDVDYNYTISLLSSQPISNRETNEILDSVLVLSFLDNSPPQFQVTCTTNLNYTTKLIDYDYFSNPIQTTGAKDSAWLNYVLNNQIVQNRARTYVFLCGMASNEQLIIAGNSVIGFISEDGVGRTKLSLSLDRNTVNAIAILIFRDSLKTTSLIFISQNSAVQVTCTSITSNFSIFTNSSINTPSLTLSDGHSTTTSPLDGNLNVSTLGYTMNTVDKKDIAVTQENGTLSTLIYDKHINSVLAVVGGIVFIILLVAIIGISFVLNHKISKQGKSRYMLSCKQSSHYSSLESLKRNSFAFSKQREKWDTICEKKMIRDGFKTIPIRKVGKKKRCRQRYSSYP